jgi:hypothetical protein
MRVLIIAFCVLFGLTSPALAQYKLIPQNQPVIINHSPLQVTPGIAWNKLYQRAGKRVETWTLDGTALNDVSFFTAIPDGKPLITDSEKATRPLPRFSATMLAPDIAQFFEQTYRIVLGTPRMSVESIEPATFAGNPGFRFTYAFALQGEEVRRKGEVNGAVVNGLLYLVSFEAPAIHYFKRDVAAYRAIVASAQIAPPKVK